MPFLVTFIPMLTDTGGNAGAQSSTLVIRMALGEITIPDYARVLLKELGVSALVGVVLSAVNFLRIMLMYPGITWWHSVYLWPFGHRLAGQDGRGDAALGGQSHETGPRHYGCAGDYYHCGRPVLNHLL